MKHVKFWHKICVELARLPCRIFFFLAYGFRLQKRIMLKKNENVLVLSNHQTDFDPIFISMAFNKPIYFLCTESVFSNKAAAFVVGTCFGAIPKKKGDIDAQCIRMMMTAIKEKGSIGIFPEGNRSYAEFQFTMEEGLAKLVKLMKVPLVLYNLSGGFGVMPRWANKKRRGKLTGCARKIIPVEEYQAMSNAELLQTIKDNLRVYDSESGNIYKSRHRAEYLERMFFVCPCCGKTSTLRSKNEFISCASCGLEVEYTVDLRLKSKNSDFKFTTLNEWYQFQKKWCRESDFSGRVFCDEEVLLFETHTETERLKKRRLCSSGRLELFCEALKFAQKEFPLADITSASVVGGRKFVFSTHNTSYLVVGKGAFNPLKYVLMFNRLGTYMGEHKTDAYYCLEGE